jgi:hypothetical protein
MYYEIPQATWGKRAFSKGILYKDVDWSDLDQIVDAYQQRIEEWYLAPAREMAKSSWHFAFSVMVIDCLLIDTLSQFMAGIPSSKADQFKDFIKVDCPTGRISKRSFRPASVST